MTGIKALTFVMFMVFAMTTDSVGIIIPEIIKTFRLSLTAAGTFQYASMAGIAVAGFFLGHLADTLGRKPTIVMGLALFALASFLFAAGNSFLYFSILLALSGIGIGVFKTGALALIGELSKSTTEHTSLMNTVEGFFGVGSIIGPAILARLLATGASWKGLYILAGSICVVLVLIALRARYPIRAKAGHRSTDLRQYDRGNEESLRAGVFAGCLPLCGYGSGGVRLDADLAHGLSRFRGRARRLQHLDFLHPSRRWALPWRLVIASAFTGRRSWHFSAASF